MRRFLIVFGALGLAALSIDLVLLRTPAVEAKLLPRKNPTSFVFHFPIQDTNEALSIAFGHQDWRGTQLMAPTTMGSSFFNPEIDWDAVLKRYREPIGKSAIYYARGEPLDYLAEFHLHLAERGPKETVVQVWASKSEVINGKSFGFSSRGPEFSNRYMPVGPTTIEEYEILLRIGQALGEKNMPPLVMPP